MTEHNKFSIWKTLSGCVEIKENDTFDIIKEKKIKANEYKLIEKIAKKGFICLDIGFNYGWFSYCFLKKVGKEGRVYAWEPNKFLYENFLKKWPFKNLKGYNCGVSDRTGTQKYYITGFEGEESGYNSLEKKVIQSLKVIDVQNIKTIKLDDWWEENLKIKVDIIKIDCEGHDYKILLGAKKLIENTKPKYLLIEQNNELISSFMEQRNYTRNPQLNDLGLQDTVWTYK